MLRRIPGDLSLPDSKHVPARCYNQADHLETRRFNVTRLAMV